MPIPSFDPNQYNWSDPTNPQPIIGGPGGFAAHVSNPVNIAALAPSLAPQTSIKPQPAPDFFNANSNLLQPPAPSPAPAAPDMSWFKPAAQPSTTQPQVTATIPQVAAQGVTPQSATPQVDPSQMFGGAPSQTQADQQRLTDLQKSGAGLNKINNPVLRTLARIGDVGASLVLKNGAQFIPGTTARNLALQGQQQDIVNSDEAADQARARAAQTTLANQDTQSQITLRNAQAQKAERTEALSKPENVQQQYSDAVADALSRGVNPNTDPKVSQLADAITSLQRTPTPKEPQRDDRAIQILSKPAAQRTPEENSYLTGYNQWVKQTKVDPGVARTSVLLQMPTAVADPNNPGGLVYTTRQGAIGQGAPGGINTQVPINVAKDMTSGADAKTLTNINTADAHIQQLGQISQALQNGDVRALNQLSNAYKEQTGNPAPTNFQLLKTALAAEIAKTTSGGVATVEETKEISKAINAANSPSALAGAAATASGIMHSKREQLKNQYTQGMQGRPNFGASAPPAGSQALSDGGVTYHIPTSMVAAFKKDHPNAR